MESDRENINKCIEALHDLIRINNDRIAGYEQASKEMEQPVAELDRALLMDRIQESHILRNELLAALNRLDGQPEEDTTNSGKIYRAWMELKTTFSGSPKSIFELCEYGEDSALKAYNHALEEEVAWPGELSEILVRQRNIIRDAHETIKERRDVLKRTEA